MAAIEFRPREFIFSFAKNETRDLVFHIYKVGGMHKKNVNRIIYIEAWDILYNHFKQIISGTKDSDGRVMKETSENLWFLVDEKQLCSIWDSWVW